MSLNVNTVSPFGSTQIGLERKPMPSEFMSPIIVQLPASSSKVARVRQLLQRSYHHIVSFNIINMFWWAFCNFTFFRLLCRTRNHSTHQCFPEKGIWRYWWRWCHAKLCQHIHNVYLLQCWRSMSAADWSRSNLSTNFQPAYATLL